MPDEQGVGKVRPIYREGDRVLVEMPSGYYVLVIQASEIIDGELWLDGNSSEFSTSFPARRVIRRLKPGERLTWPKQR